MAGREWFGLGTKLKRMDPLVSIIIVNHNRAELLRECLESLFEQTYDCLEILVVDNGSSDHSRSVVDTFSGARVRLLALDRNRGFAGGNNVAIDQARGQLIGLLNNDAVARPNWIEKLVRVVQSSQPEVGMWASKILFVQGDIIDKAGHVMYPDGQNRGRGTGEEDRGQFERIEETLFPDGCAALYRKQMLEETGGFDESFFAYGDDADLGMRGRWMGWKCLYVPDAVVYHRHSSTAGRFSAQKVYWVERNRFWLMVKNFPLPLLLLSPIFTLNRWIWNLLAVLLGRGAAGNFRRRSSTSQLFIALRRAYGDGFGQLREMLEKRRGIRQTRRIRDLEFYRLLLRFRVSARVLALRDAEL